MLCNTFMFYYIKVNFISGNGSNGTVNTVKSNGNTIMQNVRQTVMKRPWYDRPAGQFSGTLVRNYGLTNTF